MIIGIVICLVIAVVAAGCAVFFYMKSRNNGDKNSTRNDPLLEDQI